MIRLKNGVHISAGSGWRPTPKLPAHFILHLLNDAVGNPFFVVEKTVDPGMLTTLESDVPGQPSPEEREADPHLGRIEGYSPAFFKHVARIQDQLHYLSQIPRRCMAGRMV
jgi:hypothetical protein